MEETFVEVCACLLGGVQFRICINGYPKEHPTPTMEANELCNDHKVSMTCTLIEHITAEICI